MPGVISHMLLPMTTKVYGMVYGMCILGAVHKLRNPFLPLLYE